jgi:hypothetical protein
VPRDQRDLRDIESGLEQAARSLVAKIVKVQVLDLQFAAGAAKCGAQRPAVVWEDPIASESKGALLSERGDTVVAGSVEEWYSLVVPRLSARVFPVSDGSYAGTQVDVVPEQ